MSSVLEEPVTGSETSPAQRLKAITTAIRVAISWFGISRSLSPQQKAQAADAFGAEGESISASKKLIDCRHPAYKAVTNVRGRIVGLFRGISLPYPEPGVRLIRQDDVQTFHVQMTTLKAELAEAVENLQQHYSELKRAARQRLGSLYNAADYPDTLTDLFGVVWDFPSVEPPAYFQQLHPGLYQQECERVAARFNEAVQLAEEAFTGELAKLVSHLTERLSGTEDGKPKVFRDSAVENLSDFFAHFRHLSIGSSDQLDQLVDQVQAIVRGVKPQELREKDSLRQYMATELSAVQATLDGLLVDRPRRNILRRPK